jgi:beta-mannosidase
MAGDWGPRFVTSGIWRPVFLEAWDSARISDLHIQQDQVTKEQAALTAQVDFISSVTTEAELIIEDVGHKSVAAKQSIKLSPGANHFDVNFTVAKPALWWAKRFGERIRYTNTGRV